MVDVKKTQTTVTAAKELPRNYQLMKRWKKPSAIQMN